MRYSKWLKMANSQRFLLTAQETDTFVKGKPCFVLVFRHFISLINQGFIKLFFITIFWNVWEFNMPRESLW